MSGNLDIAGDREDMDRNPARAAQRRPGAGHPEDRASGGEKMSIDLRHGDCLDVLRSLPDNSVDAVVTDPPYGLSFMGKKWDYDVPDVAIWAECLRVLKPGGHLLAFAGTRTQHRMAVRIEDAGFEIRDMIAWVYGSGFPKSLDVSKAIDKADGVERDVSNPATEAARQWQGWGTALKPSLEPVTLARKPLIGTVADNVLTHGTGGINIDGCRVATNGEQPKGSGDPCPNGNADMMSRALGKAGGNITPEAGRWPANLIHDGSDEVVAMFPNTTPSKASMRGEKTSAGTHSGWARESHKGFDSVRGHNDNGGSASRFFYCAKASKKDRNEGLEDPGPQFQHGTTLRKVENAETRGNIHPTVKPTDLMRYLCRLVTPPGGVVLDPFMGSGSTGKAAMLEGFRFVGIEREAEYLEIARARIAVIQPRIL